MRSAVHARNIRYLHGSHLRAPISPFLLPLDLEWTAVSRINIISRVSCICVSRGTVEGGSVNRCFKTPVIIANTGYRKGLSRKLGCEKIAALFLHIPTSRGDRPASPLDFSAFRFSRNFSDLETPIYRAPLYLVQAVPVRAGGITHHHHHPNSNRANRPWVRCGCALYGGFHFDSQLGSRALALGSRGPAAYSTAAVM